MSIWIKFVLALVGIAWATYPPTSWIRLLIGFVFFCGWAIYADPDASFKGGGGRKGAHR